MTDKLPTLRGTFGLSGWRMNWMLGGEGGRTPVPVGDSEQDLLEWARWFETAERHVGLDEVGPVRVSTVFLGINHRFGGVGDPILFETMVFANDGSGDSGTGQRRYCTWDEAAFGHEEIVVEAERRFDAARKNLLEGVGETPRLT